jgi:hypothetical protein
MEVERYSQVLGGGCAARVNAGQDDARLLENSHGETGLRGIAGLLDWALFNLRPTLIP